MKVNKEIQECFFRCPFFATSTDGMRCNHPYWKDKLPFANMIITHENSRDGNIPEKCPLRVEQLEIIYELKK